MNLSLVPYTLAYEINKLKDKLKTIDDALVIQKSDQENILNFDWMLSKKERHQVIEDIRFLHELLLPVDSDPTTLA